MPWNIRKSWGRRQRVARTSLGYRRGDILGRLHVVFSRIRKISKSTTIFSPIFRGDILRYYRFIWLYRIQRRLQRHFLRRDRHKLDVWTRKSGSLRMLSLCICSVHSQLLTSSASSRNVTISVFHVSLADGTRIKSCDAQPRDHEVCPVPTIVLSK